MPNGPYYNGAHAVYPAPYPGPYAPPAPIVAVPGPVYGPTEVPPQVYVAPRPAYPSTYEVPLHASFIPSFLEIKESAGA